jgi:hypothetical protein
MYLVVFSFLPILYWNIKMKYATAFSCIFLSVHVSFFTQDVTI